jgi:hypothetical protein
MKLKNIYESNIEAHHLEGASPGPHWLLCNAIKPSAVVQKKAIKAVKSKEENVQVLIYQVLAAGKDCDYTPGELVLCAPGAADYLMTSNFCLINDADVVLIWGEGLLEPETIDQFLDTADMLPETEG